MMRRQKQDLFGELLGIWSAGHTPAVLDLLSPDYVGHMLHLESGERSRSEYPQWIESYRGQNPGVRFDVVDQFDAGDRLVSRVEARRVTGDGKALIAYGMNISRFAGDVIAEEWAIWTPWRDETDGSAS